MDKVRQVDRIKKKMDKLKKRTKNNKSIIKLTKMDKWTRMNDRKKDRNGKMSFFKSKCVKYR